MWKVATWIIAIAFVLALAALNWQFSREAIGYLSAKATKPDHGETLPEFPGIAVLDRFQIARGGGRSSGLWVTCSEGSQVRLALNTRLPIEEEFARKGTYPNVYTVLFMQTVDIRTYEAIKSAPRIVFPRATWRRDSENDSLLTPPLSAVELDTLSKAFLPTPPVRVRIDAVETGTEMRGTVDGRAITAFAARCLLSADGQI